MPARRLIDGCIFCGQILKWIPVLFITIVIVWSYYAYVIQLCFLFSDNIIQQVFYFIIYHILVTMLLWTYWKTIFTAPGTVPKQFKLLPADMERLEQAETQDAQRNILETLARDLPVITRTPYGVRFCEKCMHIKPDRCHHCSVCGRCVLKMDHHCPWVNNCVGYTNYKFFILFLGYALTYCLFIALTALPFFIRFWRNELEGNGRFHILFLFFVALMFAISLACLFGYHIYLVLHNRTTLEAFRAPIFPNGPDKDGFHMGAYTNFVEVFGDKKSLWFLPIFNSRGDGLTYPCRFLPSVSTSNTTTTTTNTVPSVPYYHSMDPVVNTTAVGPVEPKDVHQANLGDGVSFPQRHMAEDEDSLLGERQRWMEEGGGQDTTVQPNSNAYRVVDLSPVMAPV